MCTSDDMFFFVYIINRETAANITNQGHRGFSNKHPLINVNLVSLIIEVITDAAQPVEYIGVSFEYTVY